MNKIDKLKQLVLGVNETFHNVMMTPRIPHAESPAQKTLVVVFFGVPSIGVRPILEDG